jgi:hypothetical protein
MLAGFAIIGSLASAADSGVNSVGRTIDFNRDIRPIFNQNCTACHGGVKAEGGISFVFREQAIRVGESKKPTIVPGKPDESELIVRITSPDEKLRMPRAEHGPRLTAEQIALLRQWIAEGARWSEHWAFVAPQSHPPPAVKTNGWVRGTLDRFVLARLDRERLTPAPEAGKSELLRRVFFDLIGLPPNTEEQDDFLADTSPDAFEKQVDRLLASPRFGERWASVWLDLARYADTKGYEDRERTMWTYRDWVIDALNRNLLYSDFVIEQLAGDLLPEPSLEQVIATAFHRNTLTNDEGGTDDEEFRLAAVQDRMSTTWLALNGVTFACVQCHSHPYDPIRHEEYYKFLAFFNSTADADLPSDYPTIRVPNDPEQYATAGDLQRELKTLLRELTSPGKSLASETKWRALPIDEIHGSSEVTFELRDGEAFAQGTVPMGVTYQVWANKLAEPLTALRIEVPPLDPEMARHTPELGFHVTAITAQMVEAEGTEQPIEFLRFFRDTEDYPAAPEQVDGARGKKDGLEKTKPRLAVLNGRSSAFQADPSLSQTRWIVGVPSTPLRIPPGARLKVQLTHSLPRITKIDPIRRLRLSTSGDPRWTALGVSSELARKDWRVDELAQILPTIPGTYLPVMRELPPEQTRETRLFLRGNWLVKKGPPLMPDVPSLFPSVPAGATRNRLTLARWYFSPGQPLTARVAVNRFWEQLFGTGLVETLEDFGSVGEPPSHPELLDWLARRFQHDLHWDSKALLRELVTSATYRQSAHASLDLRQRDPKNRWLARGPRNRLSAEMVRDAMLHAAGLLSAKMHGPPVMPPQPPEMTASIIYGTWTDASGEDRYRRSIYTFWRRSDPYPSSVTFDAPARDQCSVRRMPTNTPLQALVLLNDPVYQEAARSLATRMDRQGADLSAQLTLGFRWAASRLPDDRELGALQRLYADALKMFERDATAAAKLGATDSAAAARVAVAQAIFNLDAVVSK